MSVIKATVTVTIFIIVLVSNAAFGQNEQSSNYNKYNLWEQRSARSNESYLVAMDDRQEDHPPESGSSESNEEEVDTISVQTRIEMASMPSLAEFVKKYVDPDSINSQLDLNLTENMERSSARMPKQAVCQPIDTVVDLIEEGLFGKKQHPNVVYYPACTLVKRCSGCCGRTTSCQPNGTREELFTSIKTVRKPNGQLLFVEKIILPIQIHTSCHCDCKKKDCKPNQSYSSNGCECVCNNIDEKKKCKKNGDNEGEKIWDNDNCLCICKESSCPDGKPLNYKSCACENNTLVQPDDRKSKIQPAILIEQTDDTGE